MVHFRAILLSLVALVVLLGSSYAVGLHRGLDGCRAQLAGETSAPANLPLPADLMCSKRMMPAEPQLKELRRVEVPRATDAQWKSGLRDEPMPEGRGPRAELEPPRFG